MVTGTKSGDIKMIRNCKLVFLICIIVIFAVSQTIAKEEPENLALEKPVTMSGGAGQGGPELLTDGNTASDPYLGGPQWVQIDLDDDYLIDTIKIWHYYADGRTYHDNKIALSDKGDFLGEEVVVFDTNGDDEEYQETPEGKIINFEPVSARYIRAWVGGNTVNQWSHWVEIQAFFTGEQPVSLGDKQTVTWGRIKAP
jgi:hypothetical protein